VAQIRRAAVSVTANIAEGHGRYYFQEEIQFLRIARGSLNEVLDLLHVALDEKFIDQKIFDSLYQKGRDLEKSINAYLKHLQSRKA
jgi:four helix bundle protein